MTYWAFLRTQASDYRDGFPYPIRKLGPKFNGHLRCLLYRDGIPALFKTREAARLWAHAQIEHGRPVRVKVVMRG